MKMSKEGGAEEAGQERGDDAAKKDANGDILENRGSKKKIIRLITVMAYMFSVSFVAIVLSAYYLFLWEPPNPRLLRRPVQLSGEPEMEYLLGDPPIVSNQSNQLESNSFPVNTLPKKLTGHVADNTSDGYDFVDDSEHVTKSHGELGESLFLLRNSLVEFLRKRSNDSRHDQDSHQNHWRNSSSTKYASLEKGRRSNLTEKSSEESAGFVTGLKNVVNNEITKKERILSDTDNYKIFSTLVSPTISGNETNKDSLTSTKHSIEKNILVSDQVEERVATNKDSRKMNTVTIENVSNNTQNSRSNSLNEKYTNIARMPTIINKFDIIMTPKHEENSTIQGKRDRAYGIGRLVNDQTSINSSRNLEFVSRLKFPQRLNLSAKLTGVAINSAETQTEKMTTKPMPVGNEQALEAEISTTQRQKDSLTILTETTDTSSSNVSSLTINEDFLTESSIENEEVSTKMSHEST